MLVQKKTGKLSGWIGYTLSWTKLRFDEINFGEYFWARYDRRHDISIVAIYKLRENITLSGTWIYGTGSAITLPLGEFPATNWSPLTQYIQDNQYYYEYYNMVTDYGEVNSFRMKAYHRFDVAVQFHKQMKRHKRTWEFGFYNAYSRKNPFFYFIENEYDGQSSISKLKQVSIFPIVPSITYNIVF